MQEHAVMKQLLLMVVVAFVLAAAKSACAGDLKYKDRILGQLVEQVPDILKTYDPETGRFGEGIWICRDQNQMYPLAVAYATPGAGNPYHKDPKLLEVIMKAGDALAQDADKTASGYSARRTAALGARYGCRGPTRVGFALMVSSAMPCRPSVASNGNEP